MDISSPEPTTEKSTWRKVLLWIGVILMFMALQFSANYRGGDVRTETERAYLVNNPDNLPYRSDFTLGWPSSPILHRYSEMKLVTDQVKVTLHYSSGFDIDVLSWSTACLVCGILLIWMSRMR